MIRRRNIQCNDRFPCQSAVSKLLCFQGPEHGVTELRCGSPKPPTGRAPGTPHGSAFLRSSRNHDPNTIRVASPFPPVKQLLLTMSSRPAWRSLYYGAGRRAIAPQGPYRCFSCSLHARQEQTGKAGDSPRMTHFGFQTVPESQKETLGNFRNHESLATVSMLRGTGSSLDANAVQWARCSAPLQPTMI